MFGGLLDSSKPKEREETDADTEEEEEEEPSSMANILFNKNHLSGLQKAVCHHIMDSVHSESVRFKDEWKTSLSNPKPQASVPSRQVSHDPSQAEGSSTAGKGPDTYCYELLTMLEGLSQSELGCDFLAKQSQLVQDLVSLLHTASTRIKLLVITTIYIIIYHYDYI